MEGKTTLFITINLFKEDGEMYNSFSDKAEIHFYKTKKVTLVQTDKPIYKPGETVKFRVLTIDSELMVHNEPVSYGFYLSLRFMMFFIKW